MDHPYFYPIRDAENKAMYDQDIHAISSSGNSQPAIAGNWSEREGKKGKER